MHLRLLVEYEFDSSRKLVFILVVLVEENKE